MSLRHVGRRTISYRPRSAPLRTSRLTARLCTENTWSDFFCGAGGSSLGVTKRGKRHSTRRGTLTLAVNHWRLALETHQSNFPEAHHDLADMSIEDPRRYPRTRYAWFSPECRWFTNARGEPASSSQQVLWTDWEPEVNEQAERSRATMGDVVRFARHHRYDYLIVENVVEILRWPAFGSWWESMTVDLEYQGQRVFLNSMFCWPTRPNLEITPPAWCPVCAQDVASVQAWKPGRHAGKYRQQYVYCCPACAHEVTPYYFCAANAINWSLPIERIGDRRRPLKPKTLQRIERGLARYGRQPLLLVTNHRGEGNLRTVVEHALPTHTTGMTGALALPPPQFIPHPRERLRPRGLDEPLQTPAGAMPQGFALAGASFVLAPGSGGVAQRALEQPLPTQITHAAPLLVVPWRIDPAVIDLMERAAVVTAAPDRREAAGWIPLIVEQRGGGSSAHSASAPLATVTGGGVNHALFAMPMAHPYLVVYNGESEWPCSATAPAPTITSVLRHGLAIPSAEPRLEDCCFRTLQWQEVRNGMAFPADYILLGDSHARIRQLGQAVTPPAAELLADRVMAASG